MAIAILGADTMLAALPATPVQIAHACLAAEYHLAVPASWGDELIAAECLRQLAERGPRPAVMCACPYVRDELLAVGPDLAPVLVSLVPPPVAVARYLHALYGRDRIHVTYIGGCPGAEHDEIDATVSPGEFLATLDAAGIDLTGQPRVFDSVIPPDRRRFFSMAGGVPSAEQLWSIGNGRSLVELDGEDYLIDLAQHLLSHESALIDLAPRLGCACSGASANIPARSARAAVAVIEPPRAASAVIDVSVTVDATRPIEVSGEPGEESRDRDGMDAVDASAPMSPAGEADDTRPSGEPRRRRRMAAGVRAGQHAPLMARVAGRPLPRAYVARRRTDQQPEPSVPEQPRSGGRIPAVTVVDPPAEDFARPRPAARVAAPARSGDERAPAPSIAAGAAGSPEKMGDGPRS